VTELEHTTTVQRSIPTKMSKRNSSPIKINGSKHEQNI